MLRGATGTEQTVLVGERELKKKKEKKKKKKSKQGGEEKVSLLLRSYGRVSHLSIMRCDGQKCT